MKLSLILCLIMMTKPATADQVFRCVTKNGKTVFSQFPCGDGAAVIEVDPQPANITPQESIERRDEQRKALDEQSKRLKRRSLERKVENLVGIRNALDDKRDKRISELQDDLREAYDFREKAIIESQIKEVRHQYWEDRRRLNDKIYEARMELSTCCN